MFVLIWLIQLVVYPSFHPIADAKFVDWHSRYTARISFIVMPLMLVQALVSGYLLIVNGFRLVYVAQAALIAAAWAVTFFISVPCHNALAINKDESQIQKLVSTNWIRTAFWTLIAALDWVHLLNTSHAL